MHTFIHFALLICFSHCSIAYALQDPPHYKRQKPYRESSYLYFNEVIEPELDTKEFENPTDKERYLELIDQVVRTGALYGNPFERSGWGIHSIYPELLSLDPKPPLYIQYRYHSSQPNQHGPSRDYLSHGNAMLNVASAMEKANYPKYIIAAAWLRAAEFLEVAAEHEDRNIIRYAREVGMELLVEAASLHDTKPQYQEAIAFRIASYGIEYNTLSTDEKEQLCDMLFQDPDVDEWIENFTMGTFQIKLAWEDRGNGLANSVSESQWEKFQNHLKEAHEYLTKAWKIRSYWPAAPNNLISATMGYQADPDRDASFWFQQAINARVDDTQTYSIFGNAISPIWGGTLTNLFALLDYTVELSDQYDEMGPVMLAALGAASRSTGSPNTVLKNKKYVKPITREFLKHLDTVYEFESIPHRNKALRTLAYANFANKYYSEASTLLAAGGAQAQSLLEIWSDDPRFYDLAPLLASAASQQVIIALKAIDEKDPAKAIQAFSDAKQTLLESTKNNSQPSSTELINTIDHTIKKLQEGQAP